MKGGSIDPPDLKLDYADRLDRKASMKGGSIDPPDRRRSPPMTWLRSGFNEGRIN